MASCSQTGIYTRFPLVDFNCIRCPSRWLSRGIKCDTDKEVLGWLVVLGLTLL